MVKMKAAILRTLLEKSEVIRGLSPTERILANPMMTEAQEVRSKVMYWILENIEEENRRLLRSRESVLP